MTTASTLTGITFSLDVRVSIPCKVFAIPVTVFRNIRYLDPQRITTGVIEIATCEFSEHLFILSARVENSQIKGITMTARGADSLCCEHPFWRPVVKEAWKQENIDIDKLDTSPVDVEEFIKNLCDLLVHEPEKQPETKAWYCRVEVRVLDLHELGVLVCFYVCGHWVECVHLGPTPTP